MKKATFIAITLTAALLMMSCEKEEFTDLNTVVGMGEVHTLPLELDPFDRVEFYGVANLHISLGSDQSVELSAQQNIMDVLSWEVQFGTLIIDIEKNVYLRDHEEIRFEISLPDLKRVLHDGVGDITLEGDSRDVFTMEYRGVGNINAYALPVDHCIVVSSGLGHCKVHVQQILEADISGVGNVFYRGYPKISSTDSGVGELINAN